MAPQPSSRHPGHRRVRHEPPVQSFIAPQLTNSFRILRTRQILGDDFPTILLKDIHAAYGSFLHVENFEKSIPQVPLLSQPSNPHRIRAYPDSVLRIFYSASYDLPNLGVLQELEKSAPINDDDWEGDFRLTANDTSKTRNIREGLSTMPTDLSTHTATSAPAISANQRLPIGINSSDIDQPVQIFRFSRALSPLHPPSHTLAADACPKVSRLEGFPQESTEPISTMPQHLFILPMDWKGETRFNRKTTLRFKLFRMCVCGPHDLEQRTWTPHLLNEPRPYITRSHQFIDLFAPTLLLGTRMFLASLRMLQDPAGSTPTSLHPFSDPREAFKHIQKELDLSDVGAVKTLLELMIKHLEEVLLPRQDTANSHQLSTSRNPILERSRLSLKDMALLPFYVDFTHPNTLGAYLNFDNNGNDLWVCRHHYRLLDSGFRWSNLNNTNGRWWKYNGTTGRVEFLLRTPRDLANVFRSNLIRNARVTELNVTLGWMLSLAELDQLVELATSLNLPTLSVAGASSGAGSSSLLSIPGASVEDILRHTINQLMNITITCDLDMDASTLLKEVSPLRDSLSYLKIKTGRNEVSSVISKDHLGIRHVKSDLRQIPLKSNGSFLAGKLQNLTIDSGIISTDDDLEAIWSTTLSKTIQENHNLASLTINCRAQEFKIIFDILRSILGELQNPTTLQQSLRSVILKDKQSDTAARFKIAPRNNASPEVVDVTAGTIGPAHLSVMLNFGAYIRVLNVLDDVAESTVLSKKFAHAKPTRLVSLMLTLATFTCQSAKDLLLITESSKTTLKQLILIGHPRDPQILVWLLYIIRFLYRCDVLVTRTGPASMKSWIQRLEGVMDKSSRLIVIESAEEMRLMVPELSNSGFASLKSAFDRSQRFNVELKKHSNNITDEEVVELMDCDEIMSDETVESMDFDEYMPDGLKEYGPDGHFML